MSPELADLAGRMPIHARTVGMLEHRGRPQGPPAATQMQRISQQVRALGILTVTEQQALIAAVQDGNAIREQCDGETDPATVSLARRAGEVERRARTLYALAHSRFLSGLAGRRAHLFETTDHAALRELLLSAGWRGAMRSMDSYDASHGTTPLSYTHRWAMAEMGDTVRKEGRSIRLKHAHDAAHEVQAAWRELEAERRSPSVEELAARSGHSVQTVRTVLPHLGGGPVRLDAPASVGSQLRIGDAVPDRRLEATAEAEETRQLLTAAIEGLPSPLHREVAAIYYGLRGDAEGNGVRLWDGVYRDSRGEAYAASDLVITTWKRRGVSVQKRAQAELNRSFKAGDLRYQAANRDGYAVARAGNTATPSDHEQRERLVTRLTGAPMTQWLVTDALEQANQGLRARLSQTREG